MECYIAVTNNLLGQSGWLGIHRSPSSRRGSSIRSSTSSYSWGCEDFPGGSKSQGWIVAFGSIKFLGISPSKGFLEIRKTGPRNGAVTRRTWVGHDCDYFWFPHLWRIISRGQIEAFMAESHKGGKIRTLTLKLTVKKTCEVSFFVFYMIKETCGSFSWKSVF